MSKAYRGPAMPELVEEYNWGSWPHEDVKECPACKHPDRLQLSGKDRYGLPIGSFMCTQCGVVYLDPILAPKAYSVFYKDWYHRFVAAYWTQGFGPRRYRREALKYGEPIAAWLAERIGKAKKRSVLDIGGSLGIVADMVGKAIAEETDVTVVDPSKEELKNARELGCKAECALFSKWRTHNRKWDVILVCRTIDHIPYPRQFMEKVRSVLAPDGWLFMDYADHALLTLKRGPEKSSQIDHSVNYSRLSFHHLVTNSGFKKEHDLWRYSESRGHLLQAVEPPEPVYDVDAVAQLGRNLLTQSPDLREPL